MFLLLFFQFTRYFSPCLYYTLARKMKSLFPLFLLLIALWLQKLAISCDENCHRKHYNIMSNHTTRYFHIMSNCSLWKTRGLSYKRIADKLNMVFHPLSFFFSAFFQSHLITQLPVTVPASSKRVSRNCVSWFLLPKLTSGFKTGPPAIHPSIQKFSTFANKQVQRSAQIIYGFANWLLIPQAETLFSRAALLVGLPAACWDEQYLPSYSSIRGQQITAPVKRGLIPIPTGVFELLSSGGKFKQPPTYSPKLDIRIAFIFQTQQ